MDPEPLQVLEQAVTSKEVCLSQGCVAPCQTLELPRWTPDGRWCLAQSL